MALSHNNTLAKSEPAWGSVDKTKLPRNAHADMGDADKKSSWRYPHHHVESGKIGGKNNVYVSGNMYLHRGGVKAALQAAGGARSGQKESNSSIKRHLSYHADSIGMERKETATLLGMSVGALENFLNNNFDTVKNKGGEQIMSITYEELEAKVKDMELSLSAKEAAIVAMESEAGIMQANIKSLEDKIVEYENTEAALKSELNDLKKEANGNTVYVEAGKTFIENMRSEIHKISVQVDGKDYNKELVDKQLLAFDTDVTALTQFQASLESRRAKLFKTGEIKADEVKTEQTKAQEEYALGQAIGRGNVIPIK
jgi:chromosome segregation ATPase